MRAVWLGFAPVIGVLVPLLVWQAYVMIADIEQLVLPAPWDVLVHLADDPGFYLEQRPADAVGGLRSVSWSAAWSR